MMKKSVNTGCAGQTPVKRYVYSLNEPVSTTAQLSPDKLASTRPKTSRGVSHPSPDKFYDYVIPSPPEKRFRSRIDREDLLNYKPDEYSLE